MSFNKDIKKLIKFIRNLKTNETVIFSYEDITYDILCIDEHTVLLCGDKILEYNKEELIDLIIDNSS